MFCPVRFSRRGLPVPVAAYTAVRILKNIRSFETLPKSVCFWSFPTGSRRLLKFVALMLGAAPFSFSIPSCKSLGGQVVNKIGYASSLLFETPPSCHNRFHRWWLINLIVWKGLFLREWFDPTWVWPFAESAEKLRCGPSWNHPRQFGGEHPWYFEGEVYAWPSAVAKVDMPRTREPEFDRLTWKTKSRNPSENPWEGSIQAKMPLEADCPSTRLVIADLYSTARSVEVWIAGNKENNISNIHAKHQLLKLGLPIFFTDSIYLGKLVSTPWGRCLHLWSHRVPRVLGARSCSMALRHNSAISAR